MRVGARLHAGRAAVAGALFVALAILPSMAHAQCPTVPGPGRDDCTDVPASSWAEEFASFGVNTLLGALTAGVTSAWEGRDFSNAFVGGALGGAISYGGKRIAVERFDGAGFAGRQIVAVGSSFVRNAADGIPLLERFYVPLYFVRLEVRPRTSDGWLLQPRLDAATTIWTVSSIIEDELVVDVGKSLSSGTVVFNTTGSQIDSGDGQHTRARGRALAGVILLSDVRDSPADERAHTFAHERVHTLQIDQAFAYWIDPLENRLLDVAGASGIARWVDMNPTTLILSLLGEPLDWAHRPWEVEAEWLAH